MATTVTALGSDEAGAQAIRLEHVRFAWDGRAPAVLEIPTLSIEAGARVFIEGPSGSGKSTLLSLLGGVASADEGRIEVLGVALGDLTASRRDRFRADHIGFVFQLFNLVPYLSMVENVTLPCRFSRRRRQRACERDGSVPQAARRLLEHLGLTQDGRSDRPVTELSIGQQQRVAVARALIGAPEIVIADEPTSALDEGTRDVFIELLLRECDDAGSTLLFVSHDSRLAARFTVHHALDELNVAAGNRR